jgi:hypothetical protein
MATGKRSVQVIQPILLAFRWTMFRSVIVTVQKCFLNAIK